jgi:hypothetical protein
MTYKIRNKIFPALKTSNSILLSSVHKKDRHRSSIVTVDWNIPRLCSSPLQRLHIFNYVHSFIHIPVAPTWSKRHPWKASFHFSFLIFRQSVGLLGRGISPSQGRYLHRTTQTQNKRRELELDSNPRSQCSSERKQFMP